MIGAVGVRNVVAGLEVAEELSMETHDGCMCGGYLAWRGVALR